MVHRSAGRRAHKRAGSLTRALTLTTVSLMLPGIGHIIAGRRRVGGIVLAIFCMLLAVLALTFLRFRTDLLRLSVQPEWLVALVATAAVIFLAWIAVVVRTYLLLRPLGLTMPRRLLGNTFVCALCLLLAIPFAQLVELAQTQRDLVNSVFPDMPMPRMGDSGPSHQRETPWADADRLNVLLLGADAGENRYGARTDSITVASVNTRTGETVMFGLPRNLENAPLPPGPMRDRFPSGFPDMLTNLYQYADEHPELAPNGWDPKAELLKRTVGQILGIPIHYYVMVDMAGFRGLINALGGVWMNIEEPIPYGVRGRTVEAGYRKLNAWEAMWYVRSRTGTSDYVRMARQRCLLAAVARQAKPIVVLQGFRDLAAATKRMVDTDIPRDALPDLIDLSLKVKKANIESLQFVPPLIDTGSPDYERIQSLTSRAVANPDSAKRLFNPSGMAGGRSMVIRPVAKAHTKHGASTNSATQSVEVACPS